MIVMAVVGLKLNQRTNLIVEIKDTLTMIGNHILDLHPTRNANFGYVAPAKL